MGNLMKKLKKTKMVKQFGILSLVLAMLIGVMSNGTIINAVDGNADANITFNSRIVEKVNGQDVDVSQADSGDSFFLAIYYAVSASTDASKYTECTLSITLPNDIEFDETTDISNTGFDSIEQRTSLVKNILSIKSKELAAGQSGTLYLKMHFKNMTTKNGTTAKFVDMKMTGSMVNENGSYTINPVSVPDASVTAKASQEWTVGKNVIQQADGNNYTIKSIDGKDYYSVDYKVTAAPGSNLTDLGNNYGRLNCTTFELVDTLPVAPAGREDGGAANISIKVGDKVLEEGADKDYELVLNENGTVKAIKIYYISTYESNPDDTNYVPDGAAMLTTYTINANYSKDAYRVLPNEKDDIPFILDNKVELKYLPLGENTPKYVSANAPVNVGWVDENAPTTNLDITKYVTVNGDNSIVGDNKFIFDQEKQDCYYQNTDSRIAFGLYTDEACQNAATDIDGNTVGNSKVIDKDGKVNFAKISEGTYYLKETKAPDGYRLLKDPIKIDVKATYGADNRLNYVKGDGATAKTLQKLAATASFKEFYTGAYSQYDKTLSTDVDTGTLNIKVVNKVGSKLPATGSMATLLLVATGTAVMVTVLVRRRKNEKDENSQIS